MNKLFPIYPVPNDENVIKQLQAKTFPIPKGKDIFMSFIYIVFFCFLGILPISLFPNKLVGIICISPVIACSLFCIICYLIYLINRSKKLFVYTSAFGVVLLVISLICDFITFMVWGYFDKVSMYICDYCLFYFIAVLVFLILLQKECKYYYQRLNHVPFLGKAPMIGSCLAGLIGYFTGKLLLSWTTPQAIGFLMYLVTIILFIPVVAKGIANCRYYDVIEDFTKDEQTISN